MCVCACIFGVAKEGHTMVIPPPCPLPSMAPSCIFYPSYAKLSVVLLWRHAAQICCRAPSLGERDNGLIWQHTWLAKCISTAGDKRVGWWRILLLMSVRRLPSPWVCVFVSVSRSCRKSFNKRSSLETLFGKPTDVLTRVFWQTSGLL